MRWLGLLGMAGAIWTTVTIGWIHPAMGDALMDSSKVHLGVTTLNVAWGDDANVRVSMTVRKAGQCALSRSDYWGTDGDAPKTVITRMLVTVGGDEATVPFRAYGDLGEPSSVTATCDSEITITVLGGDAAGRYSATFFLSGMVLKKRRVESRTFPDEVWEEASYSMFRYGTGQP